MSVTPNFSWPLIENTDFVTNLPADLEALADDIDADVWAIKGTADAALPETIIDAAGDLIYGSAADTAARLPLGTAGQVLTVNAGATAPEWQTPSSGAGFTWTVRAKAFDLAITSAFLANYSNGKWLVAGNNSGGDLQIAHSSDAITWTTLDLGTTLAIRFFIYSSTASLWILGGGNGLLYTSPDLVTWTSRTSSFSTSDIRGIADNGSIIVIVGEAGKVATSTDGITWTARTGNVSTNTIERVIWGAADSKFVLSANNTTASTGAAYSSDGITWTGVTTPNSIRHLAYANNTFFGFGDATTGSYSTDGITWTALLNPIVRTPMSQSANSNLINRNGNIFGVSSAANTHVFWQSDGVLINDAFYFEGLGFPKDWLGSANTISLAANGNDVLYVTSSYGLVYTSF